MKESKQNKPPVRSTMKLLSLTTPITTSSKAPQCRYLNVLYIQIHRLQLFFQKRLCQVKRLIKLRDSTYPHQRKEASRSQV